MQRLKAARAAIKKKKAARAAAKITAAEEETAVAAPHTLGGTWAVAIAVAKAKRGNTLAAGVAVADFEARRTVLHAASIEDDTVDPDDDRKEGPTVEYVSRTSTDQSEHTAALNPSSRSEWAEVWEGHQMLMDNQFSAAEVLFARHTLEHEHSSSGAFASIMHLCVSFFRSFSSGRDQQMAVCLQVLLYLLACVCLMRSPLL